MALGDEHLIKLDPYTYKHIGAVGESWLVVNDSEYDARYIIESATGATVNAQDKLGAPLRTDYALGGVALAALLAEGDTAAGHLYAIGKGIMVRIDMAAGVSAPV